MNNTEKMCGYYNITWVMMHLTNSSSIVAASTQSCWAGVSAWLSISDCRTSSKCTCRWCTMKHDDIDWWRGWLTRWKLTHLSPCSVTGLISQQQSSQGFIHLRQVRVSDQQPLKNIKAWTRGAGALIRPRMGSKVVWQGKKSMIEVDFGMK